MSNDRQKELHSNIRRLTKRIGQATKAGDFQEAENLREQRASFAKQLVEEFQQMFIIREGKTEFLSLEEAHEYYQSPDNKKMVALNIALSQVCQQRSYMKNRRLKLEAMTAEAVKALMLEEIDSSLTELITIADSISKQLGKPAPNWKSLDAKSEEDFKFLQGFDLNSLKDNTKDGSN